MKLTDAIKEKGNPYLIPDCSRDELPAFFKSLGFNTGAEIGVERGLNLEKFCKEGFKMYGIDPWEDYKGYHLGEEKFKIIIEEKYTAAVERLSPYDCTLIRKTSMEAIDDIPIRSLDFVYIDGNHYFRYVAEDIFEWAKKVRRGGAIAGHDYAHAGNLNNERPNHVKGIVDAYVKAHCVTNLYILGQNDRALSYLFFKHW